MKMAEAKIEAQAKEIEHLLMCEASKALRELVEACEYVKPFAGAVAVEASVKDIRRAGRFVKAVENAKAILERDGL